MDVKRVLCGWYYGYMGKEYVGRDVPISVLSAGDGKMVGTPDRFMTLFYTRSSQKKFGGSQWKKTGGSKDKHAEMASEIGDKGWW